MLKQGLQQKLLQKLSPQQIQFIKLLQLNTMDFHQRAEQEMIENPALLSSGDSDALPAETITTDTTEVDDDFGKDVSVDDYMSSENLDVKEYVNDEYESDGFHLSDEGEEEQKETPIVESASFHEAVMEQFSAIAMDQKDHIIGQQIIGSIDDDGYLRRPLDAIMNDLAFAQNVECTLEELENCLHRIQKLDPAGIGARTLQECLIIQLRRKEKYNRNIELAIEMMENHFDDFTKKHYDKLMKSYGIDEVRLKAIIQIIVKLNPKPGDAISSVQAQYITPDFILHQSDGFSFVTLNARNVPDLRISRSYMETLKGFDESKNPSREQKEAVQFIKQKLDGARWFIDSIRQRQQTLLLTMNAILKFQKAYFEEGDESKLKPMILKNIADATDLDISTISRVANSKYIQTDWGVIPLKFFFTEGIMNDDGEEVSSREIKNILREAIENEDKSHPLADEKLMDIIKEKGISIARRTIAKYREQLNIPVARLRKEI